MTKQEEYERKYLVSGVVKNKLWDKEHIVYQWYIKRYANGSVKKKIIFDITREKIIYVQVEKNLIEWGKATKNIEYLNIETFNPDEMLGVPFVLKRRAIKNKTFLDKFVESNGITEYLLECEDDDIGSSSDEYQILRDVTQDARYYNQNMCTAFTQKDADKLRFLLSVFML